MRLYTAIFAMLFTLMIKNFSYSYAAKNKITFRIC